jgi:hypothetical protein
VKILSLDFWLIVGIVSFKLFYVGLAIFKVEIFKYLNEKIRVSKNDKVSLEG